MSLGRWWVLGRDTCRGAIPEWEFVLYAGHARGKRLGGCVGLLTPAVLIVLDAGNALGNAGASPHQKAGSVAPPKTREPCASKSPRASAHQEFGGIGPPGPNGHFAVA